MEVVFKDAVRCKILLFKVTNPVLGGRKQLSGFVFLLSRAHKNNLFTRSLRATVVHANLLSSRWGALENREIGSSCEP